MKTEPNVTEQTTPALILPPASTKAQLALGIWNFYFVVKILLYWQGIIDFHAWENLAFALFLLIPAQKNIFQHVKIVVSLLLALALLYHDSYLPSLGRVLAQSSLLSSFDSKYLIEISGRIINLKLLALLALTWATYRFLSPLVKLGLPIVIYMAALAIMHPYHTFEKNDQRDGSAQKNEEYQPQILASLQPRLQDFYARQATLSVALPQPTPSETPFDIIFIHICSLSWDDVQAADLENHPLWKHMDYLFTHFNSASSYSGPSAIRLLRGSCGQTPNAELYQPAKEECYLMGNLQRSGFEPNLALNHDGYFDDFIKEIPKQGLSTQALPLDGISIYQHAFDGAPIYDDFSVLKRWLETRQKSSSSRVALYYNTISLHDGNRLEGKKAKLSSLETYKLRLGNFLDSMERFLFELQYSGQRAVVVIVPEHGAAVRGDRLQFAGLREIPSPRITLVPVGIKLIGTGRERQNKTLKIDTDTSYLALSQIIANMLKSSPFNASGFDPDQYLDNLIDTDFVSQNDNAVVMKYKSHYYWQQNEEGWTEYQ